MWVDSGHGSIVISNLISNLTFLSGLFIASSLTMAASSGLTRFKCVELLRDNILGIGSYGKVCRAKCDSLVCAAKIMHPTFDPTAQDKLADKKDQITPIRRFEQECELMAQIRHPNIVQYLGLYEDPTTSLPVLLMELTDGNLTDFLENSLCPIPYHTEVNMCHDIALALSFLHSNSIVHRDLSSNNVLLIGNVRAKVTDFGMARLSDLNPKSNIIFSVHPGTDAYMPPEANGIVKAKSAYLERIDCFSFGVISVQILTRQFPKPGDKQKMVKINDPQFPSGSIRMVISEIDRRQSQISMINPLHPLLPIALECLTDECSERPSAQKLCERIAALRESPKYEASMKHSSHEVPQENVLTFEKNEHEERERREVGINTEPDTQVTELEGQLESQKQQLEQQEEVIKSKESVNAEKDERIAELKEQLESHNQMIDQIIRQLDLTVESQKVEIQQLVRRVHELEHDLLRQQHGQTARANEQSLAGEQRLLLANKQLEASERDRIKFEKRVHELEHDLKMRCQLNLTLKWRKDVQKAPRAMYRSNDAVVDGSSAYFRPAHTREVYIYNSMTYSWSRLPDCLYESSPLAVINGMLSTVGGCRNGTCVDKLLSLTGVGNGRKWIEEFPPMPTKRSHTFTHCTERDLVVAGGKGDRGVMLTRVEVLNIENRQWSVVIDLPEPCWYVTILDGQFFMMGGVNTEGRQRQTSRVYSCSWSTLLQSQHPRSPERQNGPSAHPENEWKRVADLPVTQSTCVLFRGRLLAISGKSSSPKPVTEIYVYCPIANSWEVIGHVVTGRFACFAAALPNNRLMTVGGFDDSKTMYDCVEFASVV